MIRVCAKTFPIPPRCVFKNALLLPWTRPLHHHRKLVFRSQKIYGVYAINSIRSTLSMNHARLTLDCGTCPQVLGLHTDQLPAEKTKVAVTPAAPIR